MHKYAQGKRVTKEALAKRLAGEAPFKAEAAAAAKKRNTAQATVRAVELQKRMIKKQRDKIVCSKDLSGCKPWLDR